jgi:hypothetical protein
MRFDDSGWRREWTGVAGLAQHCELLRHESGELREQIELPRDDALRISVQGYARLNRRQLRHRCGQFGEALSGR